MSSTATATLKTGAAVGKLASYLAHDKRAARAVKRSVALCRAKDLDQESNSKLSKTCELAAPLVENDQSQSDSGEDNSEIEAQSQLAGDNVAPNSSVQVETLKVETQVMISDWISLSI